MPSAPSSSNAVDARPERSPSARPFCCGPACRAPPGDADCGTHGGRTSHRMAALTQVDAMDRVTGRCRAVLVPMTPGRGRAHASTGDVNASHQGAMITTPGGHGNGHFPQTRPTEPGGISRPLIGPDPVALGLLGRPEVGLRPQRHPLPEGSSDPRSAAAAAARLATPSPARMFETWFLTVFVCSERRCAISLLERPSSIRRKISRSLSVRRASPAGSLRWLASAATRRARTAATPAGQRPRPGPLRGPPRRARRPTRRS